MADSLARGREFDTDAHNGSGEAPRSVPLSDDVLVCALELLDLSDLRSAAGVSRQFYAAAWRSGLYINLKNRAVLNPRHPHVSDSDAESWSALVDQALRKNLRVAFTLHGRRALGAHLADIIPLLLKLLCAISKSLPILVSLYIAVECDAYPELCTALRAPAPFLRLRHLMLASNDDEERQESPPQINLSGIQLRSLVLRNPVTARFNKLEERTLSVPCPPVVHRLFDTERRFSRRAPLGWPWDDSGPGAIAMHATSKDGFGKTFSYADGAWRRSLVFRSLRDITAPYSLPGVPARLTYLRLHHSTLWDLLRCAADFAALRRLRVDVVVCEKSDTSQHDPLTVRFFDDDRLLFQPRKIDFRPRCPVLASLAVLWYTRAPVRRVMLDTECVLILGRALVTDAKSPVLELGDVDRERPLVLSDALQDVSAALRDVFAAVRRVPCALVSLLDQFDGDGWNDNRAVAEEKFLSQCLPW